MYNFTLVVCPLGSFFIGQCSAENCIPPEHENWKPSGPIMTRYSLNSCGIEAETVTTFRICIVILEAGEKLDSENPVCCVLLSRKYNALR